MAVKRCEANIDVVKAAEIRIKNVFGNGLPVFFSFSGGKDSLCVAQLMVNLANRGEIDMKQLTVQFIDEEAIFPCMEDMTKKWRRIFMMMGAKFEWYCVEVKHFNCFNELSNDETFICWDSAKQDVWVRQPPSFAIRNHKLLRPRIDAYQDFLPRTTVSGITMVGIRTAESVQRLQFQSTFPRGERRCVVYVGTVLCGFQSTFPRGERLDSITICLHISNFNPRSLVGNDGSSRIQSMG